jgi:hypothetical protein
MKLTIIMQANNKYLIYYRLFSSGRVTEMAGGNLGRSKSLVDFSSLRDPTELSGGVPVRDSLPFYSEAPLTGFTGRYGSGIPTKHSQ